MAYLISEEAQDLLQDVKNFCDKEVVEQCKEYDVSGEWPKEIYDKAIEQGYQALEVPEEYGGPGLSRVDVAALIEQMAIADAGFATTISASGLGMKPVLIAGSEALKQRACDLILEGGFGAFCLTEPGAGSDASAGKTTAVKDGDEYVLNGRKCFITNGGIASFYCVTAMTDKTTGVKGMSMFFVEKGTPGFTFGTKEKKMGIRGSATYELIFQDCRIPKENLLGPMGKGFAIAMHTLDGGRIGIAAQALGIAEGALDATIAYVKERKQFGRAIAAQQNTQFQLANMATQVEAAKLLVYKAAMAKATQRVYSVEAAKAKLFAAETAMDVTTKCVQLLGGYGYIREYDVERMMRDAKITEIYEGTSEVQRMVISGNLLR